METKNLKKPFSIYDIIAYLLPGATVIAGITVFVAIFHDALPFNSTLIRIWKLIHIYYPKQWYDFLLAAILFISVIYIVGHLVALLSAMFIDSFIIKRIHGYPFETMLKEVCPQSRFEKYKRFLTTGAHGYFLLSVVLFAARLVSIEYAVLSVSCCIWIILGRLTFAVCFTEIKNSRFTNIIKLFKFTFFALLLIGLGIIGYGYFFVKLQNLLSGFGTLLNPIFTWLYSLFKANFGKGLWCLILLSLGGIFLIRLVSSHVSVSFIKALKNQKNDIVSLFKRSISLPNISGEQTITLFQYIVLAIVLIPASIGYLLYIVFAGPLYAITGIYREMHSSFREAFCECCHKVFQTKSKCPTNTKKCYHRTDLYWLTSAFLSEQSEIHQLKLRHWLNLYSFARNLSMAFFILLLIGIIGGRSILTPEKYPNYYWWQIGTGVISGLLLHRYIYLYYKYYSKYIARAFVAHVRGVEFKKNKQEVTTQL